MKLEQIYYLTQGYADGKSGRIHSDELRDGKWVLNYILNKICDLKDKTQ